MRRPANVILWSLWLGVILAGNGVLEAQHESVVNTVHNLSLSGPGEIRSVTETEVCKFCHVPHNAVVPVPLWGHGLSLARYETPRVRGAAGAFQPAPQPDGASRLCLSCHDGTVALGDITGEPRPIAMTGGDRLAAGRRGFLGTDLSGSHPISYRITDTGPELDGSVDMGLRSLGAIQSDDEVLLDESGKIQCTTCHDPHADRYYQAGRVPRFWVKQSVEEVCLTCHEIR